MNASEKIKKEYKSLVEKQTDLFNLVDNEKEWVKFGVTYQHWYSRAYKVVESLAPERLEEFISYYLIDPKRKTMDIGNYVIQDYIKGTFPPKKLDGKRQWNPHDITWGRIANQLQILMSLDSDDVPILVEIKEAPM